MINVCRSRYSSWVTPQALIANKYLFIVNIKSKLHFSLLLLAILSASYSVAINHPLNEEVPLDPAVRLGTLENGFTYYIRKNSKPESRAEMRLVVNVGSVVEKENERGIAHFCEHMAFNGTEHFPKHELVSTLQSMGVVFGPDLNAFTSMDRTVYHLTIPTDKEGLLDTGILVMRDWAGRVSYEDAEIDNERGVVKEEWRLGRGADQRMWEQYLPVLLGDSPYADRLPIGLLKVIEHAPYESFREFYRNWYRPDLMALVIVGDIDLDEVEENIRFHFSDFQMPESPRVREAFGVPSHKDTLVSIVTDKEATRTIVQYYHKFENASNSTVEGFLRDISYGLYAGMLNMRLSELKQQAQPPFISSSFYWGDFWVRSLEAYTGSAIVAEGGVQKGLETILREHRRAATCGFTQPELERYKAIYMQYYEQLFSEKEKTESKVFVDQYVEHFLAQKTAPGIEYSFELLKQYLDEISLENINALGKKLAGSENRVLIVTGPDKIRDEISEDNVLEILRRIEEEEIAAYGEEKIPSELLSDPPTAGRIVETDVIDSIDTKQLKLSNGAKVYLKKTDFKDDEIAFFASSLGGASVCDLSDKLNAQHASRIWRMSGWGDFSATNLTKFLSGKYASLEPSIGQYHEHVSGYTRSQDLEIFFQLLYLVFTAPRLDKNAYESYIHRAEGLLKNYYDDPKNYFWAEHRKFINQNHPRTESFATLEDLLKLDPNRIFQIHQERFSDADDFVFAFAGCLEEAEILPLIETYIASLPSRNQTDSIIDHGIRPPDAPDSLSLYKGQDEKSLTLINYSAPIEFSCSKQVALNALTKVLIIRTNELLREEKGEVYACKVTGDFEQIPYHHAELQVYFASSPQNVGLLVKKVERILTEISVNGVSDEDLVQIKEMMLREREVELKKNSVWLVEIVSRDLQEMDLTTIADTALIETLTGEQIQNLINECFEVERYIQTTLYPERMKPEEMLFSPIPTNQ